MERKAVANKKLVIMWFLVFMLVIPNWVGAEVYFNKFVVFGTSLSDSGNFFAETGELNLPPGYDLDASGVPNSAYAIGGHHMTNGPTWIEQLAKPLGMAASVHPASRSQSPKAMNYAIDGTRAAPSPLHGRSVLKDQVDQFLDDIGFDPVMNPTPAPADAMYVIEIGSNDARDAIVALLILNNIPLAMDIVTNALIEIGSQVQRLYGAGARKFLYVNVPPVLDTPALNIIPLPDPVRLLINSMINSMNLNLDAIFAGLPVDAESTKFDFFQLATDVVAMPESYGLINVTDACIIPFQPPYKCQGPDDYLFWDVVHPSKVAHGIMAETAGYALGIY